MVQLSSNTFCSNPGKDKVTRLLPRKLCVTTARCRVLQSKLFCSLSVKVSITSFSQSTNKTHKASVSHGLGSFCNMTAHFSGFIVWCGTFHRAPGSLSFTCCLPVAVYPSNPFPFLN